MNTTTDTPEAISHPTTTDPDAGPGRRALPLYRPLHGRMLAGVAAGVADYLGVDVTIVRVILAVLTVMGGAGAVIYLAGWLLIPEEGTDQSLASELIQSLSARPR